ncbi:MAG: MBL fold metallo-hydrolase [Pseudomonadota bacterium]
MFKIIRRILIALTALVVVIVTAIGAYVYWMFYDNRMPSSGEFVLDIDAIRLMSQSIDGPLAQRIEVETLSHTFAPKIAMAAGTDWSQVDLVRNSFKVTFPNQSVLIETGQSRANAMRFGADSYDDEAWQRMLEAMTSAHIVLITHGHADHAGGLLELAGDERVRAAARLNANQIEAMKSGGLAATAFEPTLEADEPLAVAPGIVVIPAPGHTPGSQLVYVKLQDGREYLFVGDTASLADNVRLLRPRSRYVMSNMSGDDRPAVFLQSRAIQVLSIQEPKIYLVPGHDATETESLIDGGAITRGFTR